LRHLYHDQLGDHYVINYFFNSYIKILNLPGGVNKSIGPFLNYWIYGSDRPNGVNPIFFYELIFLTGNKYYGILAILLLPVIFYFMFRCYKRVVYMKRVNVYKMGIYLFILRFWLGFLSDSLSSMRSLPFLALLIVIYYLTKVKFSIKSLNTSNA